MAENDKDNKDFEFIKEQVIEKKRKKIKKRLLPFLMTIILAILFGLVAAVTFALTEPGLYGFLNKEKETKTPISFPSPSPQITPTPTITIIPENTGGESSSTGNDNSNPDDPQATQSPEEVQPQSIQVTEKIDASIEDLATMYEEVRNVAYNVNQSIVTVSSTFSVVDWFNKTVDKTEDTTGVIVAGSSSDFLILVSYDRVKDANSLRIKFTDNTYVDAVLQDYESDINLAILSVAKEDIPQIFMTNLKVATLGESYSMSVGNLVLALGSPNGHTNSMDVGIITHKGSWVSIIDNKLDLFNTDMADNPNSDGIIVNLKGEIIGIITRTLKEDVNKELSTVIGISKVQPYIEKMVNQKPRNYFGIKAEDMTEAAMQEHKVANGIYVTEVLPDSPAFEAGMKSGDIIQFINNQTVLSTNSFFNNISANQPDAEIAVKIRRTSGTTDKDMDLTVVLAEKEKE